MYNLRSSCGSIDTFPTRFEGDLVMRVTGMMAATAALALLSAGAASAQGFGGGAWYGKGFGGVTWPQDQSGDVNDDGDELTTGNASYDAGYTLGLAVGYLATPNVALELEYAYRNADTTTELEGLGDFDGSTNSNAVMVNALYRFDGMGANGLVTPYVGGGIGWANLESDIDDIGSFTFNDGFAWQLIGGVSYDMGPNWALLGEVRYFATDTRTLDGPDNLSWEAQFETVDLLIGATYSF